MMISSAQIVQRCYTTMPSPIGELLLTGDGSSLTGLYIVEQSHAPAIAERGIRNDELLFEAVSQLDEYFAGQRFEFNLPIAAAGTPFQRGVWNELTSIPYGESISYGTLARRVGNANASRAVGMANGRNPISIVIPCHRVIGADGSLTGYGGGLAAKQWLLRHESEHASVDGRLFD